MTSFSKILRTKGTNTYDGELIGQSPLQSAIGADELPGGVGIIRTKLAEILKNKLEALGVNIILNNTINEISQTSEQVSIVLKDGEQRVYDLLIGADGVRSRVRNLIFPEFKCSQFTHQGSWRVVVPRLLENCAIFLGKELKAGMNPSSVTQSYLYILDHIEKDEIIDPQQWSKLLSNLLSEFKGVISDIKDQIDQGKITLEHIVYRPLSVHLMEGSWHKNRVVLLGDSIHATTPHLASGAGIAIEGAIILSQELAKDQSLEEALTHYQKRHFERAKMVVETSVKLGQLEINNGSKLEHRSLMHSTLDALRQPLTV